NIFYMGINIGALLAPLVGEIMVHYVGFRIAFSLSAVGMVASVAILWSFKHYVEGPGAMPSFALPSGAGGHFQQQTSPAVKHPATVIDPTPGVTEGKLPPPAEDAGEAAVTEDIPPPARATVALDEVPESRRIAALIVIFLIVIVFWMVFHQNGSTLTY